MKRHGKGAKSRKHDKHNKHHRDNKNKNGDKSNQSENLHNYNEQNNNDQNEDREQHILIPGHVPGAVPGVAPGKAPGAPIGAPGIGFPSIELIEQEKIEAEAPPTEVQQGGTATTEGTAPPSCADNFTNLSSVIARAALIKTSIESLQVEEVERLYFQRKIEPLLTIVEQLSITAVNFATTSNLYQANVYVKREEMRRALKLAYNITDETEEMWEILKIRLNTFKNNIDTCE